MDPHIDKPIPLTSTEPSSEERGPDDAETKPEVSETETRSDSSASPLSDDIATPVTNAESDGAPTADDATPEPETDQTADVDSDTTESEAKQDEQVDDVPEVTPETETPETAIDSNLTFDHGIIVEIARVEAAKMDGIVEMSGGFMDGWMRARSRGIKVEPVGNDSYSLRLNLIVKYGASCVEISNKLKKRIAETVKHTTGKTVEPIQIHIAGIKEVTQREDHEDPNDPFGEGDGIGF
jgi:uncharacterized alkaline shock family protein YloU